MTTPLEPLPGDAYVSEVTSASGESPLVAFDPNNPPWTIFGAAGVWLASVCLIVLMPAIFLIPYAQQRRIGVEALGDFALTDKVAILLQVLSIIPAHMLTIALAWALVTRFGQRPFLRALGWQWDRRFGFWVSAAAAVGLLLAGVLIIKAFGGPETQLDKIINSSRVTALATAFMATATAPLVEEVVYRGVLYSALHRAVGATGAVIIVLSLFALVHVPQYWPNFSVIYTIGLLSASLTLIRAYTGKLLPCFIVHLIFNGIQSVAIVLSPYLEKFFPPTPPTSMITGLLGSLFHLVH